MAGRLTGKIAVITAAGQGIGRAIAEAFAAEGAQVIATDLDAGKLNGLAAARLLRLDVRSTEAVDGLARDVERDFGGADILVNCAGFVHHGSVLDCTETDWDFSFDLNVKSMHRTIRAFLPAMLKKERGSIVNISSVASSITGLPNRYVYGASKAAVIGLTKAVAADFIKQGIRCNAICPGTIKSPSLEQRIETLAAKTGQSLEAARQSFVDRQPMGRLGTAPEVAALAVFLASDESLLYHRSTTSGRRRACVVRSASPEVFMRVIIVAVAIALAPGIALGANCKRNGNAVTCDDGRTGIFAGDAIIWPDGTRSSSARHPSVISGTRIRSGSVRACSSALRRVAARSRSTIRMRRISATAPYSTACPIVTDGFHKCMSSSPAQPA